MLNLRTGKNDLAPVALTRRDFGKGLAAILAAGCAPSIATARGLVRGAALRSSSLFAGTGIDLYAKKGLVMMFDGIYNSANEKEHLANTDWYDLCGTGMRFVAATSQYEEQPGIDFTANGAKTGMQYTNSVLGVPTGIILPYDLVNSQTFADLCKNKYLSTYITFGSINKDGVSLSLLAKTGLWGGIPYTAKSNGVSSTGYVCWPHIGSSYLSIVFTVSYYLTWESGNPQVLGPQSSDLSGIIHSIKIYNRALSAAEEADNYAVDKVRFNLP